MKALLLILVCGVLLTGSPDNLASGDTLRLEDLRVGRIEGRARLVFDLNQAPRFSIERELQPSSLVIDMQQAESNLEPDPAIFGKTLVSNLNVIEADNGRLKVVLELAGEPELTDYFVLSPDEIGGHRLVVDIYTNPYVAKSRVGVLVPPPIAENQAVIAPGIEDKAKNQEVERPSQRRARPARRAPRTTQNGRIDFNGTWEQEWAFTEHGIQKFEATVEPAWDVRITPGLDMTVIARLRADTVGELGPSESWPDNYSWPTGPLYNSEYASAWLRELYFDFNTDSTFWRLGKQQVVWGQADGIKVLDVVNPQSFREFLLDEFDDSRIPLWTVNVETSLSDTATLQFLWIPDTTYHELAEPGSPFEITSPRLVPNPPLGPLQGVRDIDKPDNFLDDSEAGLSFSSFLAGWDITVNYLYHYHDFPVMYQQSGDSGHVVVVPEYERNHLLGGTFSSAFGNLTMRGELAYSSDTYHISDDLDSSGIAVSDEVSSVFGLDWQVSSDILWSAQWFNSYLLDYERATVRDQSENVASLLFQSDFSNATWQFRFLTLYSVNDRDVQLQAKLRYWLMSNLQLWVAIDAFDGTRTGLFGQFREQDRVLLGLEYGF